jgi:hypothetical protein
MELGIVKHEIHVRPAWQIGETIRTGAILRRMTMSYFQKRCLALLFSS